MTQLVNKCGIKEIRETDFRSTIARTVERLLNHRMCTCGHRRIQIRNPLTAHFVRRGSIEARN